MSARRSSSSDSSRCRFSFADGRHCKMPAHPDYDGRCYTHGTLAPRASRQDNLLPQLAPLTDSSSTPEDFRRAYRALSRALAQRRLDPQCVSVLVYLSRVIRDNQRHIAIDDFHSAQGPIWEGLRQLLDAPASHSTPDSHP